MVALDFERNNTVENVETSTKNIYKPNVCHYSNSQSVLGPITLTLHVRNLRKSFKSDNLFFIGDN